MKFSSFLSKTRHFLINRITEVFGLLIVLSGIFILISLISFSPSDPNFIINDNTEDINNIFGFRGSVISDFLFQSVGLISYLVPITLFFSGLNIIISKRQLIIFDNLFFCVLYIITGCLFFSHFRDQSFFLTVNGNGGFIGLFLKDTFLINILKINDKFSFYFLILLSIFFFLLSINFRLSKIISIFKLFKYLSISKRKEASNVKEDTSKHSSIYESISKDRRIQDSLPFENKNNLSISKFILPNLKLLKSPSKDEKAAKKNEDINEEFLERVLMDFGVEGKIKKINHGPVVTLNEFEPAAGVKVSKIINLSEDIARNTSSESARISTIPGSNTVGIELPNSSRENVYLSEILNNSDFKKKEIKLISITIMVGTMATILQLYAIIFNYVPIMESIKRSVGQFSSVIIGNLFFNEPITLQKIFGVFLLTTGVTFVIFQI